MSLKDNIVAIIEKGCRFEGNLSFSGVAKISGEVQGAIFSTDSVIITEEAIVEAQINAKIVIISGCVKGDVIASSRVEIVKPAKFEGSITAPSLKVEEGVIFHGQTKMSQELLS